MQNYLTIYKASAGSGKTFTLTAEYVAMIIGNVGESHRNVLAVTFTNKATAEMKHRVLEKLWEMAYGDLSYSGAFFRAVAERCPQLSNSQLQAGARVALHAIIHDYDYFHIETIDSFFQSLLISLSHELGLSAGAGVELDDKRVISQAVDELLHTISKRGTISNWLFGYVNEKILEGKMWNVSDEVKRLARQTTKEIFLKHEEQLLKIYDNEEIIGRYRDLLYSIKGEAQKELGRKIELSIESINTLGGFSQFSRGNDAQNRLIKMKSGEAAIPSSAYREKLNDYTRWIKAADSKKGKLQSEAQEFNVHLNQVEKAYEKYRYVSNSVVFTLKYLNPLRLIGEISRDAAAINSENNRYLLAKTPLLFDRLVGRDDASFVFEKAGTIYHHIMIDEFQDTSSLQWSNFRRLLIENMSTGNTCLLVGDVKQSIYRFRGGDWKILNNIENEMGPHTVNTRYLDINYRSHSEIITFNNLIFSSAAKWMGRIGDKELIEKIYADVEQKDCRKNGGYVEFTSYIKPEKKRKYKVGSTDEAEVESDVEKNGNVLTSLVEKIKLLHKVGVSYSEMSILVRYNGEAKQIVEGFAQICPEIPVISDEAFWLSSSEAVNVIVCAIRYCIDSDDDVALTYISQFAYKIRTQDDMVEASKFQEIEFVRMNLPCEFCEKYDEIRSLPLLELCERIIEIFELYKREGETAYLMAFLDGVMEYLESGSVDLQNFMTYWDEVMEKKPISSGDMQGIRVLTIHKSKGLAFRAVFLPYLNWMIEKDRNDDIMWCEPQEYPYNLLPIIPSTPKSNMKESIYASTYQKEHFDRRIENLNLAYVAFTRAQEFLYAWTEVRENVDIAKGDITIGEVLYHSSKNLFSGDLSIRVYASGVEPVSSNSEGNTSIEEEPISILSDNPLDIDSTPENLDMVYYPMMAEFRQSNSALNFVADENVEGKNDYIDKGKLIHYLFSQIHRKEDLDVALKNVRQKGLINDAESINRLRTFAESRLNNPTAKRWFSTEWQVYNECSILSHDVDGHLQIHRPDRVIYNEADTLVIDFKCGKENELYKNQVLNYCTLLRSMGYKHVKGFIWYLYSDKIIPVNDENNK
mgnify:CR=1 FL=1